MATTTSASSPVNPWGLALAFVGFMLVVIATPQIARGLNALLPDLPDLPDLPNLPNLPAIGIGGHNIVDLPDLPNLGNLPDLPDVSLPGFSKASVHPTPHTVVALGQPAGAHPIGVG